MESKRKLSNLIMKAFSQKGVMHDFWIYIKIMMSLNREETNAMYRYYDVISFNSAIQSYDDILFILAKVKSKIGKKKFKEILFVRNKIAREFRNQRKKHEELFKLNNSEPKPKLKPILRNRSHN